MVILQRMAMATSSSFLSIPLLKTSSLLSPVKHCASPLNSEFRALSLYGGRNGVSTSSAMAMKAQMDVADKPEKVVLPTNESSESLIRIRHTCAHVMAMAVQKLFLDAKVTIGLWIENGFYYDFDMEPLMDKELKRIKKEMDRIIGRNLPLIREEVSRDEAHKRITALNEPHKLEILDSIKEDPITIYHIGDEWWDLCAGPYVEKTGNINRKAVELESMAGALVNFLTCFLYGVLASKGCYCEACNGIFVEKDPYRTWLRSTYTPHVAKANLSGHLDYYKENMYDQMNVEDELYQLSTDELPLSYLGWSYQINEGGGAFYGPKIDLKIEDALGRKWQCSTLQVDFNVPQRFDLTYADSNSEKKRPIMIHRAVLGSLERFFGVLIEHYAGDFPLWLSPVQAHVLPVTDSRVCKAVARLMFQLTQEPSTHLHDGYLGYDPRLLLPAIRLPSESLLDSATDSPIFHGSAVDDAFATQMASEAFSPPSIYAKLNGQGFHGGFGGSDDPLFPAPSEVLPEEGFALREWRR
ncbi:hypothetical protein ACFX1T_036918 [Malus domestica]